MNRSMCIFDNAMKGGYDNAFDALVDAAETERRYQNRLAEEDFLASSDGFAATVSDPAFQKKVADLAAERDKELTRITTQAERIRADIIERQRRELADHDARTTAQRATTFDRFETLQQAALYFHGSRVERT